MLACGSAYHRGRLAGITRRPQSYGPVRHPAGPAHPSRVSGWRVHATDRPPRVATSSPARTCQRHKPGGHRHTQAAACSRCTLKSYAPYHDPETDYEALMVKRNASRWIPDAERTSTQPGHRRNQTAGRRLNPAFTPTRPRVRRRA